MKRARDLGIPFRGLPGGEHNAITDVAGVMVGEVTLKSLENHQFTGVTAIFPRGTQNGLPVYAGTHTYNGNGECTGLAWAEESGMLESPIILTNTDSVGLGRDALSQWMSQSWGTSTFAPWALPMSAETYDGELNKQRFILTKEHFWEALNNASSECPQLGSCGGGTGSLAYDFKGGCGSASRTTNKGYKVGVWCQVNIGVRRELVVAGIPIGKYIKGDEVRQEGAGSILCIIATDAPLMPVQLKRLAKRAVLGIGRTGTIGHNGSGDFIVAFSTANEQMFVKTDRLEPRQGTFLPSNACLNTLFEAVGDAVEEAIIDSMIVQSPDTITIPNYKDDQPLNVRSLPHDTLLHILEQHSRLESELNK